MTNKTKVSATDRLCANKNYTSQIILTPYIVNLVNTPSIKACRLYIIPHSHNSRHSAAFTKRGVDLPSSLDNWIGRNGETVFEPLWRTYRLAPSSWMLWRCDTSTMSLSHYTTVVCILLSHRILMPNPWRPPTLHLQSFWCSSSPHMPS